MVVDVKNPTSCNTWQQLLGVLADVFSTPADPFRQDVIVVPSFGHGRHIAQHLASKLGVCAGIEMLAPRQLVAHLLGQGDNPWQGPDLVLAIADIAAQGHDWMPELLAGCRLDFARQTADIFTGYWQRCPGMLLSWDDGRDDGPDGTPLPSAQSWQPQLWRSLVQRFSDRPSPVDAVRQSADLIPQWPGRLAAVLTTPPDPLELPLFDAMLSAGMPVLVWRPGPDDIWSRYRPDWPWLDDDIAPVDLRRRLPQIQIHASHGPSRQVEVLRDVLCAVFDELPDLEPREVLVLCPDPDVYAPLIGSAFAPSSQHPAGQLRVRVRPPSRNQMIQALIDLLQLTHKRATADDLLSWCRQPAIARRFGWTASDMDRMDDLVSQTGIVWGIDAKQRESASLPVRKGTWLDGVQRLVVSLATDDGSSPADAELIGGLAELVSRLRHALIETAQPAPLRQWAIRLAAIADELLATDPQDPWPGEALNALLASWRGVTSDIELTGGDVVTLLQPHVRHLGRSVVGDGNLQVRRLGSLQGVGFRVICVLGLDDASFPQRSPLRADDLLANASGDARDRSRLAWRDALLSASDAFVVIARGADERTGATLPAPVAIIDLLTLGGVSDPAAAWRPQSGDDPGMVCWHALQPYAWSNFTSDGDRPPLSYDTQALRAARDLATGPAAPPPPGWQQFVGDDAASRPTPSPSGTALTLDDLESFIGNPARYLLRQACGLTLSSPAPANDGLLPIEVDSLGAWSLGQSLLDDLLAGVDPQAARDTALARPDCPPDALGVLAINSALNQAISMADEVAKLGQVGQVVVVNHSWLTGAVPLRDGAVVVQRFGRLKAAQLATCWLRLLAVAASRDDDDRTTLIGHAVASGGRRTMIAPAPQQARELLGQVVRLASQGARQLVPLPVETAAALTGALGFKPGDDAAADAFAGRFGEGLQPAWTTLLGTPSLASLRRVGPPAFDELSQWFWHPVIAAISPGGARR